MDISTLMSLGRFKEIVTILIKYGFDDLVERLDLPGKEWIQKIRKVDHDMGIFERIRCSLEELGPTFVKFGQIMSLRPDLIPPPLVDELSKLQDDVAPIEFSHIKEAVEESTGKPLEKTFSIFDAEPLAAASISQVHRGVLKEAGAIVTVKVQRPGIRSNIEKDLNLLGAIAERLHERVDELKNYDLPALVRVTKRNLLRELDFNREARNMKIAASYADEASDITIPGVFEEYCSERLLVMDFVQGTKLKDLNSELLSDPESIARQGLKSAIKQILDDGFFHADPHPGNMLITEEERICLMDWGMTGRLSDRDRHELIDLLKSVVDKDSEALVHALLRISSGEEVIDQRGLERELLDILDSYYAVPIKDMNIGHLLMAITQLMREYRLTLPSDLVIMIKALVTAEGTARHIYPDLDIVEEAKGYISDLAMERFKPQSLWRNMRFGFSQFFNLHQEMPKRMLQLISKADKGELTLGFRHENLSEFMNTLNNTSNRLTFGIIIGAMIIGSSMIITTGVKPLLFGFPVFGVVGYLISGLLGLWVVFNIVRQKTY